MGRPAGARAADFDDKQDALLASLVHYLASGPAQPSLRQLAEAAGVTPPTIRHYFGTREGAVMAALRRIAQDGTPHLERGATPSGPLAASVADWLADALGALVHSPLGDVVAMGLTEGLRHPLLGPAFLDCVLDPMLLSLEERLRQHQARGEMAPGDVRHAALLLTAPMLLACQHQRQLGGAAVRPLDVQALAAEQLRVFLLAYAPRPLRAGKTRD